MNDLEKRLNSDLGFEPTNNANCKDCAFRRGKFGNSASYADCSKYVFPNHKPLDVMQGGDCPAYEKEIK